MQIEITLAVIAIALSLISLYVSARAAWDTTFRPAEVVGVCPYLVVWILSSWRGEHPTGEIASRHITPSFWLSNTGAKKALVADLRILLNDSLGNSFYAYPASLVPIEAIESPSQFHEYQKLNLGGPFSGFCLQSSEVWKCNYAFWTTPDNYQKLRDTISAEIQILFNGSSEWVTVIREQFDFGSQPIHLQSLMVGGFPAGARVNHVFSESWKSRRDN